MPSKRTAATAELDSTDEVPIKVETKKPKKTVVKWTPQEDAIFIELAEKVLKAGLWDAVKADGRLAHRKSNGVYMRIAVMLKKMSR